MNAITPSAPAAPPALGPDGFNWKSPDYVGVFRRRIERLNRIRARPEDLPLLRRFYRDHPAQFITDWGCTFDPRNPEIGLPSTIPFILFPKQAEWVDWTVERWRGRKDTITEKSRDMGISWLAVGLAATLCIFHEGMAIGFGSKTEDDVDKAGDPGCLFWKARQFVSMLPPEFRAGYDGGRATSSHMRVSFPATGSILKGDAGDDIGRGDRTGLYFVDESAALRNGAMVDNSLSQTTNSRHDLSTPRGRSNRFAERRFSGKIDVFTFHWRADPRKDEEWYARQVDRLSPVSLAQEVDLDYSASVTGVLIPSAWVQAAVGAAEKLGVTPTGERAGAFDVADEGEDMNAFCMAHGVEVQAIEEWSGKDDDIFGSSTIAVGYCDQHGCPKLKYDADGLGAGVRGDVRVLNEGRARDGRRQIQLEAFRGSASVVDPEGEDEKGRKNKDYFRNFNAQTWWRLRRRFQMTYRAVRNGAEFDPDEIISLDPSLPLLARLCNELSQPTYSLNTLGKIVVDKQPPGTKSPNLADAVKIRFSRTLAYDLSLDWV